MSKLCYEAVVMKTEWWGNFQPGKHYCNNNNNSNKQLRNTVAAWTLSVKLEKSIPYIHTEYAYRQCINIETGRKVNYESIEKNILFSLLLSNTEKRLMHAPGYPRSLPYLHTHTTCTEALHSRADQCLHCCGSCTRMQTHTNRLAPLQDGGSFT